MQLHVSIIFLFFYQVRNDFDFFFWIITEVNTIGINIIASIKIRNDYGAIQSLFFQYSDSNIGLFFIIPCKVNTLNPLCILFGISSLLLFWWLSFKSYRSSNYRNSASCRSLSHLKAIAKSLPLLFDNAFKRIKERNSWKSHSYMESNTEKKPWTNLQNFTKIEAKRDWDRQLLLSQSWKSDNLMGSNREKSNIAIAYFIFKGNQKLFRILMVAIIFSPTVLTDVRIHWKLSKFKLEIVFFQKLCFFITKYELYCCSFYRPISFSLIKFDIDTGLNLKEH